MREAVIVPGYRRPPRSRSPPAPGKPWRPGSAEHRDERLDRHRHGAGDHQRPAERVAVANPFAPGEEPQRRRGGKRFDQVAVAEITGASGEPLGLVLEQHVEHPADRPATHPGRGGPPGGGQAERQHDQKRRPDEQAAFRVDQRPGEVAEIPAGVELEGGLAFHVAVAAADRGDPEQRPVEGHQRAGPEADADRHRDGPPPRPLDDDHGGEHPERNQRQGGADQDAPGPGHGGRNPLFPGGEPHRRRRPRQSRAVLPQLVGGHRPGARAEGGQPGADERLAGGAERGERQRQKAHPDRHGQGRGQRRLPRRRVAHQHLDRGAVGQLDGGRDLVDRSRIQQVQRHRVQSRAGRVGGHRAVGAVGDPRDVALQLPLVLPLVVAQHEGALGGRGVGGDHVGVRVDRADLVLHQAGGRHVEHGRHQRGQEEDRSGGQPLDPGESPIGITRAINRDRKGRLHPSTISACPENAPLCHTPPVDQQYFSARPSSKRRPRRVEITLDGERLAFATDAGVFSPGRLDLGTATLLGLAPPPPDDARVLVDLGAGWGPISVAMARR
ncbi:MAG: methyltransferase, partial [Microthrixaceae bacterium]|nr:methyltransferase [Microthrixaceae bacterium]